MVKVYFDDIEILEDAIIGLEQDYKMFEKNFYLGATPCRSITLEIEKENFDVVPNVVKITEDGLDYAVLHVDNCELIDEAKYKLELSDAMTLLNEKYDAEPLILQGETTLRNIVDDICEKFGLTLENEDFYGSNKKITWFDNTISARGYIGFVAELNGGYAVINGKGNLEFKDFSNDNAGEVLVEECGDFTVGEKHKIARVVYDIGVNKWEQQDENYVEEEDTVYIDTENVYITEQADILNIFNKINGFEFYSLKTDDAPDAGTKIGETINFVLEDNVYPTITQIKRTYNGFWIGGYELNVNTNKQEETKVDGFEENVKTIKSRLNRDEAQLEIVAQETKKNTDELGNVYTKQQVNELVLNAETGVTNTFSEAGGNNILRNTGLWFKNTAKDAEENPYEFWTGIAKEGKNDNATNYKTILLQNGSFSQEPEVPNGNYSVSFYYRVLNPQAIASVVINEREYPLDSLELKQFYTGEQDSETNDYIVDPIVVTANHIKVEFKCDVPDGVEVYDLMCNKGTVKLAYSQNQNETTTNSVNISKGITITSTADDTKFKADYDGIRIVDNDENETTKFTIKGTETNELIVRKKAQITGLLHQEVDDQTWVTKI